MLLNHANSSLIEQMVIQMSSVEAGPYKDEFVALEFIRYCYKMAKKNVDITIQNRDNSIAIIFSKDGKELERFEREPKDTSFKGYIRHLKELFDQFLVEE